MSKTTTPRRADQPGFCDDDRKAWAETRGSLRRVAKMAGVSFKQVGVWRRKWCPKVTVTQSTGKKRDPVTRPGNSARPDVATAQERRDLALEMQDHQEEILAVLVQGLAGEDPLQPDQIAVARIMLDRGWGKPFQAQSPALGAGDRPALAWDMLLTIPPS